MDVPVAGPSPFAELRRASPEPKAADGDERFTEVLDVEIARGDIPINPTEARQPAAKPRRDEPANQATATSDDATEQSSAPPAESIITPTPSPAPAIPGNANLTLLNFAQAPTTQSNANAPALQTPLQTANPEASKTNPVGVSAPTQASAATSPQPAEFLNGEAPANAAPVAAPLQPNTSTAATTQPLAPALAAPLIAMTAPTQTAIKDAPAPERGARDMKASGTTRVDTSEGPAKKTEFAPAANNTTAPAPIQARNDGQTAFMPISVETLAGSASDASALNAQPGLLTASNASSSATRPGHTIAAQASMHNALSPAAQTAQHIIRNFDGGASQFEVRLDPPELGRIDVRLEIARDQSVQATVSVEQPATLVELARHARDLERALQEAGLFLSPDGLNFDLAQNTFDRATGEDKAAARHGGEDVTDDETPAARPISLSAWRAGRVDIWA